MSGGLFHSGPDTALLPAARPVYEQLVAAGLAHRYAMHRRSSQAFGLNLFAPLQPEGIRAVLGRIGLPADDVDAPIFEYVDETDRLAESNADRPHQTQVDVMLRGRTATGERLVALIEVKFTETDFGHCSAYASPANPHPEVCRSAGLFGNGPEQCFQLTSHGTGRRQYDRYLAATPVVAPQGLADSGGCLVRESLNQPMRNLALAQVLLAEGHADRVAYVLCAPSGHLTIWRRFAELRAAFPNTTDRTIRPLTAEVVAAFHPDAGAAVAGRYPAPALQLPAATESPQGPSNVEIEAVLRNAPRDRWHDLRVALTELQNDHHPVTWPRGDTAGMSFPSYSEAAWRIHEIAYQLPIVVRFDWPHWNGFERYQSTGDFQTAPAGDIARWITTILRAERFYDGVIAQRLDDGSLVAALRRLLNWYDTSGSGE